MRDDAPLIHLVLMETLRGSPMLSRIREQVPMRNVKALTSIFREHCAAGRLRDVDPYLLAQSFGGTVLAYGVVAPVLRGDPVGDPKQTAREIADLFLLGALPCHRSTR